MEHLKLSYELDRLNDVVEERVRLITALGIQPSRKDNVILKKQLSTTLDILNEVANVATDEIPLEDYISQYNDILENIPNDHIDTTLYHFQAPPKIRTSSASLNNNDTTNMPLSQDLRKKVRFKDDDLVAYNDNDNDNDQFKPYRDEAMEEVASDLNGSSQNDRKELFSRPSPSNSTFSESHNAISPMVSNQEIFIQQQQQLLQQDSYLNAISNSVQRSHNLSLDINNEVTEQNDQVLQDLESLVDSSGRNLDRAKRRLEIFEKSARENGPCFIIVILTLILFLLIIVL